MSTVKDPASRILGRMPKLWNATIETHRATVRDAILDAAAGLVAERGLRGLTMAEVAARAGIARATLYKYFGHAETILRAWHEREIAAHLADLAAIAEGPGEPADRLAAVLERYARTTQAGRGGHDAEVATVLHRDEHVSAARHRLRRLLAGVIAEAAAAGSVRDEVSPDELASYALHALGAASEVRSPAAVRRLVTLTMAGMRASRT